MQQTCHRWKWADRGLHCAMQQTCHRWKWADRIGRHLVTQCATKSTVANSAFHPFGVDKWGVSCNLMLSPQIRGGTIWWMRTKARGRHGVVCRLNCVIHVWAPWGRDACHLGCYINPRTFTFMKGQATFKTALSFKYLFEKIYAWTWEVTTWNIIFSTCLNTIKHAVHLHYGFYITEMASFVWRKCWHNFILSLCYKMWSGVCST